MKKISAKDIKRKDSTKISNLGVAHDYLEDKDEEELGR